MKKRRREHGEVYDLDAGAPAVVRAEDLTDRDIRGIQMHERAQKSNGLVALLNDDTTIYWGKRDDAYRVTRERRNVRGTMKVEYRCSCPDFTKHGRLGCMHIFADRLRREEVRIEGAVDGERHATARAGRRPARKRFTEDGRPLRTAQRTARVAVGGRVPQLIADLKRAYDDQPRADDDDPEVPRGKGQPASSRAAALVFKIAEGKSADDMVAVYARLIEDGVLDLDRAPHQNTLSAWINDAALTPVLERMHAITVRPFRAIEIGAIVDSSKLSQMRTAHSRWIEYGDDVRDAADWMKIHALVGVETLICIAVMFSGSRGPMTHDVNFVLPLVKRALKVFALRFLLGDKAYLAEEVVGKLWSWGLQAVIPIKKKIDVATKTRWYVPYAHLVEWHDHRQADFHEVYRLRPKIEAFFSMLKRTADGYCWSRGRPRKDAGGRRVENADVPCTAWVNEALCKVIYVNLRRTVEFEISTGYTMNYLADTFFPRMPKDEKLIA